MKTLPWRLMTSPPQNILILMGRSVPEIKIQNTIVNGITITSANDAPERDPKSFVLSGSNDGEIFVKIASGSIPISRGRGKLKTMRFPNGKVLRITGSFFRNWSGEGNILHANR